MRKAIHTSLITGLFLALVAGFSACSEDEAITPKPLGYLRFDFPERNYETQQAPAPVMFPVPDDCILMKARNYSPDNPVFNLEYPHYKGTIHMTYRPVEDNLFQLVQNSRDLALEHTVKASDIDEIVIANDENKVYGLLYEIKGNVASNLQFYLTDSTNHFMRGALYIAARPNADSLLPIVNFMTEDVKYLIENLEWAQPEDDAPDTP